MQGVAGAHQLRTDAPALAPTVEQEIRGNADPAADWIFLVCGYEPYVLRHLALPAPGTNVRGLYRLSLAALTGEIG